MAEKIPAVNKATEAARNAIRRVSAYSLPNNPSERGMKPDEIKRAFWQPIIGLTQSVMQEQDRIVDEFNTAARILDENRRENSRLIGHGEPVVPDNLADGESGLIGLANATRRRLDFHEEMRVDGDAELLPDEDPHQAQKAIRERVAAHNESREAHADIREKVHANTARLEAIRAQFTGEGAIYTIDTWANLKQALVDPSLRVFKLKNQGDEEILLGLSDLVTGDNIFILESNTADFYVVRADRVSKSTTPETYNGVTLIYPQDSVYEAQGYLFTIGTGLKNLVDGRGDGAIAQSGAIAYGDFSSAFGFNESYFEDWHEGEPGEFDGWWGFSFSVCPKAFGKGSHARGHHVVANGDLSEACGDGYFHHYWNDDWVAYNSFPTKADEYLSYARGYIAHATAEGATANGYAVKASGKWASARGMGKFDPYEGPESIMNPFTVFLEASGVAADASGYLTLAKGDYSSARGHGTEAHGQGSSAEGRETEVYGANGHVEGQYNTGYGAACHVEGSGNNCNGSAGHVQNKDNILYAKYGHVGGAFCRAEKNAEGIFMHGNNLRSNVKYQAVLGEFNEEDPDARLILGGGTSLKRANALVVKKDGSIYSFGKKINAEVTGKIESGNQNPVTSDAVYKTLGTLEVLLANI